MPAQTSIPVAATVLGTIGTVFWCIQLVPQVWYNWKKKDTEGLPAMMMFLWVACAVPFGVYAVVQNFNIPIQIQPQVFCVLALIVWAQILVYSHKWKPWTATAAAVALGALCGGLEVLLILTLRGPYEQGVTWPMILVGVIGAILIGAGLIPPYWELWKRKGRVIGINWIFLSIDSLGALFSLLALGKPPPPHNFHSLTTPTVAQNTFDVLGAVLYLVVLVFELGIFTSHIIWRLRTRKLRKRAKVEGIKFDDLPEARKYQIGSRADNSIELDTPQQEQQAHAISEVPWGEEGPEEKETKGQTPQVLGNLAVQADELPPDLERGSIRGIRESGSSRGSRESGSIRVSRWETARGS